MTLSQIEQAKYMYLKAVYDSAVDESPSSPYSVMIDPFELGRRMGFDVTLVRRVAGELTDESYLNSTLGLRKICITSQGVQSLVYQEKLNNEMLENTYDAYTVTKDEYEQLKLENRRFEAYYNCYLKVQIITYQSPTIFNARIRSRSLAGHYDYFSKNNSYRNTIIRDYNEGRCPLFTFDGFKFYEATNLKLDTLGIYEFTLIEYNTSDMSKTENGINIQNLSNSNIQIQNNSPNAQQHYQDEKADYGALVEELRKNSEKIGNHISDSQRKDLILAVDYLESQMNNKKILPSIVGGISESLKSVPSESLTSILSSSVLKLLGL